VAVEVMKSGANDYLMKDSLIRLVPAIKRELLEADSRRQRKRVEKELHESQARLEDAQRIANIGHLIWDKKEDRQVYCSGEAARIFGLPRGKLAKVFDEQLAFVHPDDREHVKTLNEQSRRDHNNYAVEYKIVRPDGGVRHVREIAELEFDEGGEHVRTISTIQDITQQRFTAEALRESHDRLEQRVAERTDELRESEQLLKQAVRIAGLGHYMWDELEDRCIYASEEYAQILGVTVDEVYTQYYNYDKDIKLVHPDDRERLLSIYVEFQKQGGSGDCEFRIIRPDGELRYVREMWDAVVDDQGRVFQTIGIMQDITERKLAELDLRTAREVAEAASTARSDFMSRMSHELRTPMNAILGFAQLLQTSPEEKLNEKQPEFVEHILKAGQHLLTLIDELLDLARIDSGHMQLLMEAVDPGVILSSCVDLVQSVAVERKVKLNIQLEPGTVPALWADTTRLQQTLLNLLSNAVKYNHEGGRVTVTCEVVENDLLRISISDTGPGIPKARMAELFQPFERLGAEQSAVKGTGIGLTITKRLVEMMGGELGVDSVEGKGSTFWIDVPISNKQVEAQKNTATEQKPVRLDSRKHDESCIRTFLYIEDNPSNIKLMESIIDRIDDTRLITAYNAELGLDLARSEKPDLIMMDINLPGMSGTEALQQLQGTAETKHIPVIAISADAMPREIKAGMKSGFRGYITKPINIPAINRAIEEILGSIKISV